MQHRLNSLWASLQQSVDDCAWEQAEGLLRRFLQLAPASPLEVWDTLGYVLLMQGDYRGCQLVLEPRRFDPTRSFWLEHKLGDAHRGLNQLQAAVECYRRSLRDGSDSPITCRNLLQALDAQEPGSAIQELKRWQQKGAPSSAAWDGARQAAVLVPGLTFAQQLFDVGEADAVCRQRLLEDACYAFDQSRVQSLLAAAQLSPEGFSAWERALQQRLETLGLAAATSDPAFDAPQR